MIHIVDEDGSTLKNSCWRDLGVAIISAPSNWSVLPFLEGFTLKKVESTGYRLKRLIEHRFSTKR